jgi:L-amino acid N-acyltransferase YncA
MFMSVREKYHEALLSFIRSEEHLVTRYDHQTVQFLLEREDALRLEVDVPDNFQIRSLSLADFDKVFSYWPHQSPDPDKFIKYVIKHNPSVGLYDENNELIAWCMMHDFGSLLLLQVVENHLRKGYGVLVTKAIAKKIAEVNGHSTVASVVTSNFKSINLFEKLQFKRSDTNYWVGIMKN